jgi:hypothetical protein
MSEPESHRPAPDEEAPDEPAPEKDRTEEYCWIYCDVDDLNVRRRPTTDSESVGQIHRGDSYWATCHNYDGGRYQSCRGGDQWVAIWHRRRWRYVARRCVTRYGP